MSNSQSTPDGGVAQRWEKLPRFRGRCNRYLIRIDTRQIGYVNAILESFDDVARVRTRDNERGILEIVVPSDWDGVFHLAVEQLAGKLDLQLSTEQDEDV